MARSFLRAWEMRRVWKEVPCVILTTEIEERHIDGPEFRLSLAYGYEWLGTAHTGERLTLRGNPWSSDRRKIEKQADAYPVSARLTCRVNPADPRIAVLKPDSLAPGYSIWFPALFVAGGAGLVIGVWRKLPRNTPNQTPTTETTIDRE